jgi:hypothetical protein
MIFQECYLGYAYYMLLRWYNEIVDMICFGISVGYSWNIMGMDINGTYHLDALQ